MGNLHLLIRSASTAPDPEVVLALERLLDEARSGRIRGLVCVAQRDGNIFTQSVHGSCLDDPDNVVLPVFKGLLALSRMTL